MWIKTRVGITRLAKPFEIRASKSPKSGNWAISAVIRGMPDIVSRGLLTSHKITSPWFHLAWFRDRDGVQQEIAQALETILTAVRANADVCDLSKVGQAEAWDPAWRLIDWP